LRVVTSAVSHEDGHGTRDGEGSAIDGQIWKARQC
jgi:hypothetical protein